MLLYSGVSGGSEAMLVFSSYAAPYLADLPATVPATVSYVFDAGVRFNGVSATCSILL